MDFTVNSTTVSFKIGDITKESVEVIVNAANSGLRGGGGVDGAIHRVGGPKIMEECRKIGGCPAGQAVITTAGNLPARYVIHAVGPIYANGQKGEPETLRRAYLSCLLLASQKKLRSLAFPSLSTGAYGYPIQEASKIALHVCLTYLKEHRHFDSVSFVLFSRGDYEVYVQTLKELFPDLYSRAAEKGTL